MTSNHFSSNNESLENNNSDKPVSLYLSELENQKNQEEIDAVYNELLNIIYQQKRKSLFMLLWTTLSPIKLKNIFFNSLPPLFFFTLCITLLTKTRPINFLVVYLVLGALFAGFVLMILPILIIAIRGLKSSRELTHNKFNKIQTESLVQQEKISKLRSMTTQENLKAIEINIETLIKEVQKEEKRLSSRILIFAIVVWVICVYIVGLPNVQEWVSYLERSFWGSFGNLIGIPGAVVLLASILNIINIFGSTSRIEKYEQCLVLLKKAQIQAAEIQTYPKSHQFSESGKKQSFMSRVRNISIDASADSSVNHDKKL